MCAMQNDPSIEFTKVNMFLSSDKWSSPQALLGDRGESQIMLWIIDETMSVLFFS